jgi:Flp pilus assembly protein TadG
MYKLISFLRRQKGQAITEFALILPFLLLLIGGIVDFGLAFFIGQMTENAAREGARVGATIRPAVGTTTFPTTETTSCQVDTSCGSTTSTVLLAAKDALPASNLFNGFTITSTFSAASSATASDAAVEVVVEGAYNWFLVGPLINSTLPLIGGGSIGSNLSLSRAATMRWEWQN